MEKRSFGRTDMLVTALGFGGAEIGFEEADLETVARLLNAALDAGLNVIDTAECYKASEELIGRAVSHRRSEFNLFTKCGHNSGFELPDWDPQMLEHSIDRSLRRLKTDRLDLIQLHSCSEDILRRGDVIAVLQRAREKGKTRYVGYSGDGHAALYAVQCRAFDSLQTSISIGDQESISLTVAEAAKLGMGIIAKRPIANAAWKFGPNAPENGYVKPYWERLRKLGYDFLNGGMETGVSTALRFTLSVPGVCTAIVGTKNPDRWAANARLLESGPLSADEFESIRKRWAEVAESDWVGQV